MRFSLSLLNNNNFINVSRYSRFMAQSIAFFLTLVIIPLSFVLLRFWPSINNIILPRFSRTMSQSSNNSGKKLIRIDVSSDSVCPWCIIGKKNLDKAIAQSKDQFDFEVRWHPYLLNPSAPKEGVSKRDIHREKLGPQYETIMARTVEMFRGMGLEYDLSGLTGNTMDSHRLITYAAHQGYDKQHALVEELFVGYFSKGKFIGDHKFLVECAEKIGVEGAAEFLKDPNNGVQEVYADLQKYSGNLTGVPYYVVNGKHKLNGGQPPEVFLRTFQKAAKDSN